MSGVSRLSSASEPPVMIPGWVSDFATVRRWSLSDDFPEKGSIFYLHDRIWVDLSMETALHNQIEGEFLRVLATLSKTERLGRYFGDRMRLVHPDVGLSAQPDGMFVSAEAIRSGEVVLEEGDESLEVIGAPAVVLEVISKTSEKKDLEVLPSVYFEAGIEELWLVDSRIANPELTIQRRGRSRFVPAKRAAGWVSSGVFGKSFRLLRSQESGSLSDFTLEVR